MKVFEVTERGSETKIVLADSYFEAVEGIDNIAMSSVVDVSAEYPIDLSYLCSVLQRANYGSTEIELIIRTLKSQVVTI